MRKGMMWENGKTMKKFQVSIKFHMNDEFMALIPDHRKYVNALIEK